jgi:DNA-binding NtrC family response regulator
VLVMARILIVDDDSALRESLGEAFADLGHIAIPAADGAAALAALARDPVDAVILDLRMPGMDGLEVLQRIRARPDPPPVAVLTAVPTSANTIEAMRLGAVDHLVKPVGRKDLAELIARMLPPASEKAEPPPENEEAGLIAVSAAMREVLKTIGLLADNDATVLITGETGTGKEIAARAIHQFGRRSKRKFIAINCAAIPGELLESELFGHVRGAFTGAVANREGAFREAHHGTLLLDEIGDMSLSLQAKLLRVLETREIVPLGGQPEPIDVRIIAATNRDLAAAVRGGSFREDLFYRLSVVPLAIPPLRDRLADIIPLAEHFLARASPGVPKKRLSADAAARLLAYPWPGNVRELRNAMERVAILNRRPVVTAEDLDFLAVPNERQSQVTDWLAGDLPTAMARLEAAMIRRALAACGGNRAEAARRLGIHRQLLYTKLRKLGLDVSGILTEEIVEADIDAAGFPPKIE